MKSFTDKIYYLNHIDNNKSMIDLDLFDPVNAHLLIANNWQKFRDLSGKLIYSETRRIYQALLSHEKNIVSILLIGSVARGCHNLDSDIDLVVICDNKRVPDFSKYGSTYKEINILSWAKSEFENKYKQGIELYLWCVNYGLLLYDKNYFVKYYSQPDISIRQDEILSKRTFINNLLLKIYEAIAIGDMVQATRLVKVMSIQVARIFLISHNIIPKSRPELMTQLKEANSPFTELIISENKLSIMTKQQLVKYTDRTYKSLDKYLNNFFCSNNTINRREDSLPSENSEV